MGIGACSIWKLIVKFSAPAAASVTGWQAGAGLQGAAMTWPRLNGAMVANTIRSSMRSFASLLWMEKQRKAAALSWRNPSCFLTACFSFPTGNGSYTLYQELWRCAVKIYNQVWKASYRSNKPTVRPMRPIKQSQMRSEAKCLHLRRRCVLSANVSSCNIYIKTTTTAMIAALEQLVHAQQWPTTDVCKLNGIWFKCRDIASCSRLKFGWHLPMQVAG